MKNTNCCLCGKNNNYKILYKANLNFNLIDPQTFSARRSPDRVHYQIVCCNSCGLIRSNPILPQYMLVSMYKKSEVTYQQETKNLQKTYGHYLKKALPLLLQKQSLLDIGCGNGFFLEEALSLGFKNVFGVEPSKKAKSQAVSFLQKKIVVDFFHKELFLRNSFDIVCCFHALDHVLDPNQFLNDTNTVLKKSGLAFFITHNAKSFLAKLLKDRCPIFDIEHIYLFDKKTLPKMFKKHGFEILDVFNIHNTYSLSYWMSMSPIPQKMKLFLREMFDKSHLAKLSFTLPVGNIGILARKTSYRARALNGNL